MKGADAEDLALKHLLDEGHELLARNFRVPGGELDLVTRQKGVVVFTEVKHRHATSHGAAAEMLTARKLALLRRTAAFFLHKTFGRDDVPCRFDFVAIQGDVSRGTLLHLENVE
ncbi:YraN family protein [Deinococcus yavapaiensis]|uniref:UPF0102 protein DES52_10310 n=1 Tax=Deinococcus yavapaiensis KR-236 TaxID=694435 RepID=A0A318SDQ1_9DEIO|nr:YraN family protein [Deinococcus yavapaiensis]PYE55181.1 putative endonuclease [Deinococcus yavapaiensis KR-236]